MIWAQIFYSRALHSHYGHQLMAARLRLEYFLLGDDR